MARNQFTQAQKDEAVQLYKSGLGSYTIAKRIGCSYKAVLNWVKNAGIPSQGRFNLQPKQPTPTPTKGEINANLLRMAGKNSLTPYVGRVITEMQPREIYDFLRLLNLQGTLTIKQTIFIN